MLPWILLIVAGLFEVAWALLLKQTAGWTRLWPSLGTIALMIVSFVLLARTMRDLPAGTSYAVWTGIGTVGVALLGMLFYKEPATLVRVACIALIVVGIVGLKVSAGSPPEAPGSSAAPPPPAEAPPGAGSTGAR